MPSPTSWNDPDVESRPTSITFWTNVPSMHQEAWIRALARDRRVDVHVVADDELSLARRHLGWRTADVAPATLVVAPSLEQRREHLAQHAKRSDVHVFSGTHAYPGVTRSLRAAVAARSQRGPTLLVLAESGRWAHSPVAVARWCRHAIEAARLDGRIDAVLAYGAMGVDWYRSVGFSTTPVLPVAYFQDPSATADRVGEGVDAHAENLIDLTFVGRLQRRKGVDVALRALRHVRGLGVDARLSIVGDGEERVALQRLATALGVDEAVRWWGALGPQEVRNRMRRSHVVVVPSRFDGWGAVVTEALQEGAFVLTSPFVGAGVLLDDPRRGRIVRTNEVVDWSEAIRSVAADPHVVHGRDDRRAWTRRHLDGVAGATYFLSVAGALIDSTPGATPSFPPPPWADGRAIGRSIE